MKKTFLAAGLVVVFGSGLVGCKTTPKLAFWKKDAAADATAIAHSAPALPSDLAKQGTAGATGATSVAQSRLTEAAPFVPGQVARTASTAASPANYPSTDAPPFTPDVATRIASAAPPTTTSAPSSHLGSIAATPYNPAATPAPTASQTAATTPTPESRYGSAATSPAPVYGQPPIGAMAAAPGASNATAPATSNPLAGAPASSTNWDAAAGDRYGSPATTELASQASRYGDVNGASASIPVTPGTNVTPQTASTAVATTAQPYRPGGTGTYASSGMTSGSQPAARLASRPQETSAAPATTGTSVPNVARPGDAGITTPGATAPTTTPGRYW